MLPNILLAIHVIVALALVGLILIQHGKGADAGAAFGSGASSTVFGAQGSGSFMTRTTSILAAIFFATSLSLAYLVSQDAPEKSVTEKLAPEVETPTQQELPPVSDVPAASDIPDRAPDKKETSDLPELPSGK